MAYLKADQHRTEDLLVIAVHIGLDLVQNGRPYKVAALIARDLDAPAIQDQLCALHPHHKALSGSKQVVTLKSGSKDRCGCLGQALGRASTFAQNQSTPKNL